MIHVDERGIVAGLLAGAPAYMAPELVDDNLRSLAIAIISLRAWRALVTTTVEELVTALGGDPQDVEQLRREGAMRRAP